MDCMQKRNIQCNVISRIRPEINKHAAPVCAYLDGTSAIINIRAACCKNVVRLMTFGFYREGSKLDVLNNVKKSDFLRVNILSMLMSFQKKMFTEVKSDRRIIFHSTTSFCVHIIFSRFLFVLFRIALRSAVGRKCLGIAEYLERE